MLLCLKCYVDKEDNLMFHGSFNVYALYCLHLVVIICLLSQSLASQNSVPSGIRLVLPYPETNFFHLSPPYLPTCGIPLPLLKYIIYVLSLDVKNLLLCTTDSDHKEVALTHDLLNLEKFYLGIACLICKPLIREGTAMSAQLVKDKY